jgi:arginine decarboxylase
MLILVTSAIGHGPTELAAFDSALVAAGVADRNLIYLSSVLPPASCVRKVPRIVKCPGDWGDRLYCVMAACRVSEPGVQGWSGLGWMQDASGRGLLVEHESDSYVSLCGLINASMGGLCDNRAASFPTRRSEVAGVECRGEPACALVVAVFESAAWNSVDRLAPRSDST